MVWIYRSRVGTFWIRQAGYARFVLGIGEEALGTYGSPILAADDVYTHSTGYDRWDRSTSYEAPESLSEWQRIA